MSVGEVLSTGGAQIISCYTPPDTPRAEGVESRSSSPCPSLNSTATTIEPDLDGEDSMFNSMPVLTNRLPVMAGAKYHDGMMHVAGGTQEPHTAGGLGSEETRSAFSDQAVDGGACKPAGRTRSDDQTNRNRGDDGDDGRKAPAPRARAVSDVTLRAEEKRYACPYRKWNPVRFNIREYSGCSSEGFNMARLKEHLKAFHAPRLNNCVRCRSNNTAGQNACACISAAATPEIEGHMSVEAMGKIIRIDSGSHKTEKPWVAIYQSIFGDSELVPEPDWEAPIELEEVFAEIRQNINVLRERVKHEAERLVPQHIDTQNKVWSSFTHLFIFFLEQTLSSCQQRVRGNSSISMFGPLWPRGGSPAELDQSENTPHDFLGLGTWAQAFHYNLHHGPRLVHRDFCGPSSLMLAVRNGEQEFYCRVSCTEQQLWAILGFDQQMETFTDANKSQEAEDVSTGMNVDEDPDNTPDCSSMDISGSPLSQVLPSLALSTESALISDEEGSRSCVSDGGDDVADEVISRICDMVLEYCGGPAAHSNIDLVSQAVGSAVADFVHELFDGLTALPQMNQCGADGGSSSALNPNLGSGGYGASSGEMGGAGLGGQGLSAGGGAQERGLEGNGPPSPKKGATTSSDKNAPIGFSYSCPYRKHNPLRFSINSKKHKQCATVGWNRFDHLKRHLRSKHKKLDPRPHKCQKCKDGFSTEKLLEQHLQSPVACQFSPPKPSEEEDPDDGITLEAENRLASRGKDKIICWNDLYRMLFPNAYPVPSPEFEPPDETCGKIQKRFQDAEPALRQRLDTLLPQNLISLITPIICAVRGHQNKVFTDYELSLQGTSGTKRRSLDAQLSVTGPGSPEVATPGKRRRLNTASEPPQQLLPDSPALNQDWNVVPNMAAASQLQLQDNESGAYSQPLGENMMIPVPTSGVSCFPIHGHHHHVGSSSRTWPQGQTSITAYASPDGDANWYDGPMVDYSGAGPDSDDFQLVQWGYENQGVSGASGQVDGGASSYHLGEPPHD
ncbi:hypothetical protein B0T25DRAFT_560366 [Lasiosphaeria hispida]|uniref:C2H2-type domain-containing protein n=1 Tax=Lasiosphaeria hispida TaxID=260671 RepID=A0AAJ0H5H1_9PEZI|nr:hypothetical protein B0T25DRAFT_560366 [Lasiosphaeria hispida]